MDFDIPRQPILQDLSVPVKRFDIPSKQFDLTKPLLPKLLLDRGPLVRSPEEIARERYYLSGGQLIIAQQRGLTP